MQKKYFRVGLFLMLFQSMQGTQAIMNQITKNGLNCALPAAFAWTLYTTGKNSESNTAPRTGFFNALYKGFSKVTAVHQDDTETMAAVGLGAATATTFFPETKTITLGLVSIGALAYIAINLPFKRKSFVTKNEQGERERADTHDNKNYTREIAYAIGCAAVTLYIGNHYKPCVAPFLSSLKNFSLPQWHKPTPLPVIVPPLVPPTRGWFSWLKFW